jgi:hypothetical protein
MRAVVTAFKSAGFDTRCLRRWGDRAGFCARARPGLPEFLTDWSGEGFYYDILVKHLFGNKPFTAPQGRAAA